MSNQSPPPPPPPPSSLPPLIGGSIYASPPGWGTQLGGVAHGVPAQFAGFGARLGALLLDGIFSFLALIPAGVVAGILLVTAPTQRYSSTDVYGETTVSEGPAIGFILGAVAVVALTALLFTIWNQVLRQGRTGQTLGKKVSGIRVVGRQDGQPIGSGRGFGRWMFSFISGNVCYLGYLWALWDPMKQTWHDKIVDSVVIRA